MERSEEELGDYINKVYLAVLGRPVDEEGKKNYVQLIKEGKIKREVLEGILRSSDEYRDRISAVRDNKEIADFVKAKFIEVLNRMVDIGGLTHYTKEITEGRIKKEELETILMQSDEYKAKGIGKKGEIVFCQGTYEERMDETKRCVEQVRPHVDRAVIIVDETVTEENKEWLREHGCDVHIYPWADSMPAMRNAYLSKLRYGDFVCVSDPDELYGYALCENLRSIISDAEENGYGLLLVAAHDVVEQLDGKVHRTVSGFKKNLIFKYLPDVSYEGIGEEKTVHEVLHLPEGAKEWTLPDDYYYEHIRSKLSMLERSFRNVYLCGGGIESAGSKNPYWQSLREFTAKLGLVNWGQVREYLRSGNISLEFLEWIKSVKGLQGEDYLNETRECYNYYKAIHPREVER